MEQRPGALVALALVVVLAACGSASVGDKKMVTIHYKGTLDNGTVFDSSEGREPLQFLYGAGQLIPALETALKGMKVGEKKHVTLKAAEAYGEYDAEAVQEVPKEAFPPDITLEAGLQLVAQTPAGPMPIRISELKESTVMVDFNHPLAGKDLTFDVEIVAVRDATKQELEEAAAGAQ